MKRAAIKPMQAALDALPRQAQFGQLREGIAGAGDVLDHLEYARLFVPYLVSVGLLAVNREAGLLTVAFAVATERFELEKALQAVTAAADDEQRENASYRVLDAGLLAGYVLGLAAGQQLGADVFRQRAA
jgi:hypothetical protein